MDRYGLPGSTPQRSAYLPRLALPVLRAPSRRALRVGRRHPHRRRHGPFSGPPEPRARPPARLGQPLRRPEVRADSRRALARAARPTRLRGRGEPCPGLRSGRERLEPLRRGVQPGAGLLLPPLTALGRAAHRGRVGLPVDRRAFLRARFVGGAHGRPARPSGGGRQRRGGGAGEGLVGALVAPRCRAPVRLRRGLRSRQAAARLGGSARARPGEAALQPRLLRRPRRGREKAGGAPAPPRQEVRPARSRDLAGARPRAPLHDGGLRRGAREGVAGVAPEDAAYSGALRVREGARCEGHRGSGGGGQAAPRDPQAQGAVALVLRRRRTGPRSVVARLRKEVRPRAHDPLPQADARVDHAEGQIPRTGGPLDLAPHRRLCPTEAGPLVRGGPPPAVGAPAARAAADAMADASGFRDAPGGGGHPGKGAETLREIAGTAQRAPLGPGEALPGTQESRLNGRRRPQEEFRDGLYGRREIPPWLKDKLRAERIAYEACHATWQGSTYWGAG